MSSDDDWSTAIDFDDFEDDGTTPATWMSTGDRAPVERPAPVVAVVGRPNVGKSTLVNRIIGRRQAVVEDVPGVTRDRVAYDAQWSGRRFTVVDTGGWEPDARDRAAAIAAQAEIAAQTADVVLFVVDATVGATDEDEAAVRMLRRSDKPVILVANKVDNDRQELEATSLWSLGLGQPYASLGPARSRLRRPARRRPRRDAATRPRASRPAPAGPRRVALVGRPNVGKSQPAQPAGPGGAGGGRLGRRDHRRPGRQPGRDRRRDLAVRRHRRAAPKVATASGTEYYASLRTAGALEAAEVAIVLLDAGEVISEQDQRILTMVTEAGRALVLAFNKWDLVDEDRRYYLDQEIDRELRRIPWAIRVNISAQDRPGRRQAGSGSAPGTGQLGARIPTGQLNQFITTHRPGDAAPGPGRPGAAGAVRDPGRYPAAALRAVHHRSARRRLHPFRGAQTPRGVRLRRLTDPDLGPPAQEAGPLTEPALRRPGGRRCGTGSDAAPPRVACRDADHRPADASG